MDTDLPTCPMCERRRRLTFHHLIPRAVHRRRWARAKYTRERLNAGVDICRDCHSAIHRFFSETELARHYNSVEALREHPQMASFLRWIRRYKGARAGTRTWSGRR